MIETSGKYHIYLVSDSTGETLNAAARACLAQFENIEVQEHVWSMIRSLRQLDLVIAALKRHPGLVLHTFADDKIRETLETYCRSQNIPTLSVLDPVLHSLADYLGRPFAHQPGRQHRLDAEYFARIEAMDYAMALDDGQGGEHLQNADVIILGVSRTSKTPTCIYLAGRGVKAANIPVVPDCPLPEALERLAAEKLVVGLTKEPHSLVEIRIQRLKLLHGDKSAAYIDPEKVQEEVLHARRIFARLQCPVIDVTRRSIEETAAEIMMLLHERRETETQP